jgi:hypothetical protein
VVAIGSDVNFSFLAALATGTHYINATMSTIGLIYLDYHSTYITTDSFNRLDNIQQPLRIKLCVRLDRLDPSSGPTRGGKYQHGMKSPRLFIKLIN